MINRSFPSNWTVATLGKISSYIQRGKSPKYVESSPLAVINQKCIRWNQLQTEHQKYIHPEQIPTWDANRHIRQGDILWNSTGTGTVGRAYLVKSTDCQPQKVVDSHVTIVRSNPEVDSRIIFYWIKGPNVQNRIEELCDGSTNQVELSRTAISEIKISLPPISEQRRIADKLDRVLARIDAANEHLSRVAPLIKRFRQSVLAAAVSGRLTDACALPSQRWKTAKLGDLGTLARGKSKHRPRNDPSLYGGRYPFIQTGDIANSNGLITHHSKTYNDKGLAQSELWPKGTLCITIAANIADTAILDYDACFPDSIVGFLADESTCIAKFVKHSIDVIKEDIERLAPATAQKNINLAILSEIPIRIPSVEEQSEIVRRVEKLFAFADRLEERLSQAQAAVQKLTPALLAKAFRGELVPQDPNDEPASELLKRLQESRTDSAKPGRARKPRTKKSH